MEGQMSLFNTPEVSGTSALKVSRDFGEHIGGARKELWSAGGINLEDLLDMNDAEKAKFVKKDNIWKKPGDRKSTRLNSSHTRPSRMPSSA